MSRHLCLISLLPLSATGGGERYSLATANSIQAAGDTCVVFSPDRPLPAQSPLQRRLDSRFVQVDPRPPHRTMRALDFRTVLDHIADADAVLLHQFLAADPAFDVIENVCSDQILLFTNLGKELLWRLFQDIYQPGPNHIFVEISRFSAKRSLAFSRQAIGVSGGIWRHDLEGARPRQQQASRVCAVGRVLPHKGFEITVDAIADGMALTIVGPANLDPVYFDFVRRRAAGKPVEFAGQVDDLERDRILSSCRTLVASSCTTLYSGARIEQAELLGLVIFEALARFCLPIASDLPPFVEVMNDLGLGEWIYPQRDSKALARLLEDASSRQADCLLERILDARDRMLSQYAWETYWQRVLDELAQAGAGL